MICWCVVLITPDSREMCTEPCDLYISGEAGHLKVHDTLNPIGTSPCWHGGSCGVSGYGIGLHINDTLTIGGKAVVFGPSFLVS